MKGEKKTYWGGSLSEEGRREKKIVWGREGGRRGGEADERERQQSRHESIHTL